MNREREDIVTYTSDEAQRPELRDPELLAEALGLPTRPTSQQRDVITAPLSPLLVVAGAGSGKTATMADRVVWLVANGLARPEQILGVTFTRKAAGELSERLRRHLQLLRRALGQDGHGDLAMEPAVSTYHSFANSLVAEHGMRIGLEPDAPVWGPAQCWQLATRVVDAYDGDHTHLHSAPATLVEGVLGYASQAAEHLVDPADTVDWLLERADALEELPFGATARSKKPTSEIDRLRTHATVARLAADYQAAKATRGIMDYGDLVAHAARLALLPEVQQQYRSRYPVVLLDEFQDTSHAQIELFARLFADGRHAVTAVGDPNQAIYGFRGASAGQLAAFTERFALDDGDGGRVQAPVAQLTTAWRNSRSILRAANVIAAPLNRRPAVPGPGAHLADGDDAASAAARAGAEDSAGVLAPARITLPRPSTLRVDPLAPRPGVEEGRVVLSHAVVAGEEAVALADFIAAEREAWHRSKESWPSVAVLTRKRATMAPIAEELRARGIPVEVVGLGGLLGTPEVQDVVATLRVLADPGRSDALMRLLAGARWRIGPADLMALGDYAAFRASRRAAAVRDLAEADFLTPDGASPHDGRHSDGTDLAEQQSLVEALDNLPQPGWTSRAGRTIGERARGRLARLAAELRQLRRLLDEELPLLVTEVIRTLGIDVEVLSRPGPDEHAARRHLDSFADVVAHFDGGEGRADVPTFLAWLDAALERESGLPTTPEPAVDGTVQLLTVHASKGLEWDIVAVPALNRGTFPSSQITRWTKDFGELPWPWRGDAAELPQLSGLDDPAAVFEHQKDYEDFEKESKEEGYAFEVARHAEREERRLAYVAFTRARAVLWCSATDFSGLAKGRVEPSPFFSELERSLPVDGAGEASPPVGQRPVGSGPESGQERLELEPTLDSPDAPVVGRGPWVSAPPELEENPESGVVLTGSWPYDPLAGPELSKGEEALPRRRPSRRPGLEAAAEDVRRAAAALSTLPDAPEASTDDGRAWAAEAELLLRERADERRTPRLIAPQHVRASLFVEAADDRAEVERDLRRPVPHRPGVAASQGTAFHTWVEERLGVQAPFDLDADPLDADALDEAGNDNERPLAGVAEAGAPLASLQAKFLASEWAERTPYAVEVPLETRIGPVVVRGRIDAVFAAEGDRWHLVDWKTGRIPSREELPRKALQLAVYRVAWSRLHDIPLERIDAAFYYVAHGRTVWPDRLADEAELERLISELFDEGAGVKAAEGEA